MASANLLRPPPFVLSGDGRASLLNSLLGHDLSWEHWKTLGHELEHDWLVSFIPTARPPLSMWIPA